ncbi:MAG: hypothetical protein WAU47_02495, partial [Desulfobaccales bacterium]
TIVGLAGTGTFTQNGGTFNNSGIMVLGQENGATGSYSLQDGTLTTQSLTVGLRGAGTFEQQGGSLTVNDHLKINDVDDAEIPPNNTLGSGSFTQTGGTANIANLTNYQNGQVHINNSGGAIVATTIGNMTNYGAVEVTGNIISTTTVTFTNYVEHGSYTSNQVTTNIISDLIVESSGYLVGGAGDEWHIGNNFMNYSSQNASWNTGQSTLSFFQTGGPLSTHKLTVNGLDFGAQYEGYTNNFAWGILDLRYLAESTIVLEDADETEGGALYVRAILGLEFDETDPLNPHHIVNLYCPWDINVYYDPDFSAYLNGLTYSLDGGGSLVPVHTPLPGSVWLLLSGLAGLGLARGWRLRKR